MALQSASSTAAAGKFQNRSASGLSADGTGLNRRVAQVEHFLLFAVYGIRVQALWR